MRDKNRIAWIDVAKGICMIAVIAGHMGVSEINNIVFPFHLTVFFILSGYTLKLVEIKREYLNKKFRTLMIPYFITCFCVMFMDVLNQIACGGDTSIESVTGLISRDLIRGFMASGTITTIGSVEVGSMIGAIWFYPALFFALIFTQIILKNISDKHLRFIVGYVLLVFAVITRRFVWLPFSIQSGMCAVLFLLVD